MPVRQQVSAVVIGLMVLVTVVELVRRRKLREEFSVLWLVAGGVMLLISSWFDFLRWLTGLMDAELPVSVLFFFGIIFLVLVTIHLSVRVSELSAHTKDLAQEIAILRGVTEEQKRE